MPNLVRTTTPIRVSLQLPSELWNELLAAALQNVPGLQVMNEDDPRLAGLAHVVVTAVPSDRAGWTRLSQSCRRQGACVLVLGEHSPALAARALRLGACGYLDWESPLPRLVKAIRGVHAGELWAERKVALTVLRPADAGAADGLTPRELRVLEALAEGKRNKEIAAQLAISETTVKSHLNRAYQKLHVSDRLGAVLYVERHGLE
ncbi:MAG: response regulator transcription factor [Terriglobales bacterium]